MKRIYISTLLLFLIVGFVFRFISISHNLSFWNDESNAAMFSRAILERGVPVNDHGRSLGVYSIALFYITALSYVVFGISEFAARFPSIIAGTALIATLFVVTRKLVNEKAGLVAAFLGAFLQIQLAWSTQLRPYIWLQLFSVLVLYFTYRFLTNRKRFVDKNLIYSLVVSIISALFHGTAMISVLIIGFAIVYKAFLTKQFKYIVIPFVLVTFAFMFAYFSISPSINNVIAIITQFHFEPLHYRIFLTHNYLWLLGGSFLGVIALWRSNKQLLFLIGFSTFIIFAIAVFKLHPRYVRYSLQAFPLLYILFGIGMAWGIDVLKNRIPTKFASMAATFLILIVFLAYPIFKGKFVFVPQKYYSINADMRENPIVDYKTAFAKIQNLIKEQEGVIIMDAWNDRVPWYLPGQEFIWLVRDGNGKIDPAYGEKMIGTIEGFEYMKSQYGAGIVIVENWQSMTPPELQKHIQDTLRFEFTQETVPGNEQDPWSISIYSWGL